MTKPIGLWVHIPLSAAYYCEDCGSITNTQPNCPACASIALMPLANVLNRSPQPEIEIIGTVPSTERLVPRLRGNSA